MNGRVEVITGPERRRRWSDEEKLQLTAEACQPGNSVSQVARERGISASQLFGWRRQMLAKGLVTDNRSEASVAPALTFAPVEIAKEQPPPDARGKVRSARRQAATRCWPQGWRQRASGCGHNRTRRLFLYGDLAPRKHCRGVAKFCT